MEISLVFPVHPSEDLLEEYAFGRMNGARLDAVEEHLLVCEACQKSFEQTEEYIGLVKQAVTLSAASREERGTRSRLRNMIDRLWISAGAGASARTGALIWTGVAAVALLAGSLSLSTRFSPVAVPAPLQSYRGGESTGGGPAMNLAPAHQPLDLTIPADDLPPAPHYRIEVVAATGRTVWSGTAQTNPRELKARIDRGLPAGLYWVRLYDQNTQLSEFGLQLN